MEFNLCSRHNKCLKNTELNNFKLFRAFSSKSSNTNFATIDNVDPIDVSTKNL